MRKESNLAGIFCFQKCCVSSWSCEFLLNVSPMAGNSKRLFRGSDNQVRDLIMVSNWRKKMTEDRKEWRNENTRNKNYLDCWRRDVVRWNGDDDDDWWNEEATERNLSFSQNSSGINESILVFLVCPINLTFVCRPPMTAVGRRELSKERRRAWLLLWARPSFCHRPELHCSRPSRNSIRCRSHRSSRSRRNLRSLHSRNSLKSKKAYLEKRGLDK